MAVNCARGGEMRGLGIGSWNRTDVLAIIPFENVICIKNMSGYTHTQLPYAGASRLRYKIGSTLFVYDVHFVPVRGICSSACHPCLHHHDGVILRSATSSVKQ